MSSVSVTQKRQEFQPVNVAITLSTEKDLRYFISIMKGGIESLEKCDGISQYSLMLTTNLLTKLEGVANAT